jgi:hypothetical protein
MTGEAYCTGKCGISESRLQNFRIFMMDKIFTQNHVNPEILSKVFI